MKKSKFALEKDIKQPQIFNNLIETLKESLEDIYKCGDIEDIEKIIQEFNCINKNKISINRVLYNLCINFICFKLLNQNRPDPIKIFKDSLNCFLLKNKIGSVEEIENNHSKVLFKKYPAHKNLQVEEIECQVSFPNYLQNKAFTKALANLIRLYGGEEPIPPSLFKENIKSLFSYLSKDTSEFFISIFLISIKCLKSIDDDIFRLILEKKDILLMNKKCFIAMSEFLVTWHKYANSIEFSTLYLKEAEEKDDLESVKCAYWNLANAFEYLGKLEEAKQNYEKLVEKDKAPENLKRLYRIYQILKDPKLDSFIKNNNDITSILKIKTTKEILSERSLKKLAFFEKCKYLTAFYFRACMEENKQNIKLSQTYLCNKIKNNRAEFIKLSEDYRLQIELFIDSEDPEKVKKHIENFSGPQIFKATTLLQLFLTYENSNSVLAGKYMDMALSYTEGQDIKKYSFYKELFSLSQKQKIKEEAINKKEEIVENKIEQLTDKQVQEIKGINGGEIEIQDPEDYGEALQRYLEESEWNDPKKVHEYFQKQKEKLLSEGKSQKLDKPSGWSLKDLKIEKKEAIKIAKGLYAYIDDVLQLDELTSAQFKNALEKGFATKKFGQNGIKLLPKGLYELKINEDARLFSDQILLNPKGKKLILFNALGNHSALNNYIDAHNKAFIDCGFFEKPEINISGNNKEIIGDL